MDLDLFYEQVDNGVGVADADDTSSWLRRPSSPRYNEMPLLQEKACLDMCDRRVGFCKIYHVGSRGRASVKVKPADASPSLKLWRDPGLFALAAKATFMIEADFSTPDGSLKMSGFTGFVVAPGRAFTAGHPVDEWQGGQFKGSRSRLEGCEGAYVLSNIFSVEGFKCEVLGFSNNLDNYVDITALSHHPSVVLSNKVRLPTNGSDIAVLHTEWQDDNFLLPCSYDSLASPEIAVVSYPHVTSFMLDAKSQLKDGVLPADPNVNDIWDFYKHTMNLRSQRLNIKATRSELFSLLEDTFHGFSTGDKVVSVGLVTGQTSVAIAGSYSTLGGSSGAPICPVENAGYFVGVQNEASLLSDANVATSTDAPAFIDFYKQHALPYLPHSSSPVWSRFDLRPFEAWLGKHGLSWEHTHKRKREDEPSSAATSPTNAGSAASITYAS